MFQGTPSTKTSSLAVLIHCHGLPISSAWNHWIQNLFFCLFSLMISYFWQIWYFIFKETLINLITLVILVVHVHVILQHWYILAGIITKTTSHNFLYTFILFSSLFQLNLLLYRFWNIHLHRIFWNASFTLFEFFTVFLCYMAYEIHFSFEILVTHSALLLCVL